VDLYAYENGIMDNKRGNETTYLIVQVGERNDVLIALSCAGFFVGLSSGYVLTA